jgi:hypothetical protein
LEQKLTAYGEAGWELAWVLMELQLHGEKGGHVFIFKTPAPPKTQRRPGSDPSAAPRRMLLRRRCCGCL